MKLGRGLLVLIGVFVFALAVMGGYQLSGNNYTPQQKASPDEAMIINSGIDPYQISFQEGYSICYAHKLGCTSQGQWQDLSTEQNLATLELDKIKALYLPPQWQVEENGHRITLYQLQEGICPKHKAMMHLGVNASGEYLTVYYGPSVIGSEGGVYLVTDVLMAQMDEGQKEKIANGYFELYSNDELMGLLDSFSELE